MDNGKDMVRDGDLIARIMAYPDGPNEMREVIRHYFKQGANNVKLSINGEDVSSVVDFFILG